MIGECRSELVTNADAAAQPTGARPAPYGVFGGVPPRLPWPSCYRRSRRAFSDSRAWNLRPGTHEKLMRAFLEPEVFAGGVRMRAPAAPGATAALELGGSG